MAQFRFPSKHLLPFNESTKTVRNVILYMYKCYMNKKREIFEIIIVIIRLEAGKKGGKRCFLSCVYQRFRRAFFATSVSSFNLNRCQFVRNLFETGGGAMARMIVTAIYGNLVVAACKESEETILLSFRDLCLKRIDSDRTNRL